MAIRPSAEGAVGRRAVLPGMPSADTDAAPPAGVSMFEEGSNQTGNP